MRKIVILLVLLGLVGFAAVFFVSSRAQPVDLGVLASEEALLSFRTKIGNAPASGIVAGGMPISGTFTSSEITSSLVIVIQKHKLPIEDVQVRFSEGFFEASGVVRKVVKGDFFVKGTVKVKGPRSLSVTLEEVSSNVFPITPELKDIVQKALNGGIRGMFDKFGPDERFLNIQTLTLRQDALVFSGIVPLEFLPFGSDIRF